MPALTGAKGTLTIPTADVLAAQVLLIARWTASFEREIFDISAFPAPGVAVSNARDKLGGMYVLVGTCEGPIDGTATPIIDKLLEADYLGSVGWKLTLDRSGATDGEYTFDAIISGVSLDVPKTGPTIYSLAFRSTKKTNAIAAVDRIT